MSPYDAHARAEQSHRRRRPYPAEDDSVLAEVLERLTDLAAAVSRGATKEDLDRLVTKENYETQRTADQQIATITATRLTNIEGSVNTLKDDFHKFQLADAQKIATAQLNATQQIGQVQTATTQQIGQAQATTAKMVDRLKDFLLGTFASGFFGLLIFVATHSFR